MTRTLGLSLLGGALLLLAACGGGCGGGGTPTTTPGAAPAPVPGAGACGEESQKQFVFDVAREWYRWYDELAPVDPADYATADAYLAALTAPLAEDFRDPGFSYLTTVSADEANFSTGAYAGFGFRFTVDSTGRYLISDVFETGTAFAAGFRRGAELLAVDAGNGFTTLADFEARGAGSEEIFGPPTPGVERGFRLRVDGAIREVLIAKTELDVPPLARAPRLLERAGLPPVGYLHLRAFTESANAALQEVFGDFRDAGVTDLVVDLRFNGGGSIWVAERLLDLLGGEIAAGDIAYRLRHNDRRRDEDYRYRYRERPQSIAPNRIAFITTATTASASELVINSVAPYVETVLVGGDTLGKAVGQYAFDQSGCEHRLRLVAFDFSDADGQGGFYTGLVDTGRFTLCAATERARGAFGDPTEPMLGTALAWLDAAECPAAAPLGGRPTHALSRQPPIDMPRALPDRRSPWMQ